MSSESWTDRPLDNPLDAVRLQEIYSRTAAFYDGVVAAQQAAAKLAALETLARQPGERCLELGVGTAWAFSRLVAESGVEKALGVDLAPGMLEVARQVLREAGVAAPNLALADGRRLPLADGSFDCLLTTYTLEVMPTPEIPLVLGECLRVLRPGGRIVVVSLTDGEGADAAMTEDWKRRYAADPEYFGGARPLRVSSLLSALGFVDISRQYVGPEWPSEVVRAYRAE